MRITIGILLAIFLFGNNSYADRLKDLARRVAGVRTNQLIGYGLVVGLQGTGDGSDIVFTAQSLKSMLTRLGGVLIVLYLTLISAQSLPPVWRWTMWLVF